MSIKEFSYEEIRKKAKELRKVAESEEFKKLSESLPSINNDFLKREPFAPLIGTICDERIKTQHTWEFPEWLSRKIAT